MLGWIYYESSFSETGNVRINVKMHGCSGKSISITYSESVFRALGTQHAVRTRHIVTCGLSRPTLFFHIYYKTARFSKRSYWTQDACFDFLYNFCLKHFSFQEEMSEMWSKMYIGLYVKYQLFLSYFNETWIFSTFFRKIPTCRFYENPSSGSRVDPCGWTDITTLIIAFRNFANAPKNYHRER
jgi:hypothetical protein